VPVAHAQTSGGLSSPYLDEFENFNSEGWVAPGPSTRLFVATSTGCNVGACVYDTSGGGHQGYMFITGNSTAIGGFRIYFKAENLSSTNGGFVAVTAQNVSRPGMSSTDLYAPFSANSSWQYMDVQWTVNSDGNTIYESELNGNPFDPQSDWTVVDTGGAFQGYNKISLANVSSTGVILYFDSLSAFGGTQGYFTSGDLQNQSYAFQASTTIQYCDSLYSTSTSFLSELGSTLSQSACQVGAFLFVPSPSSLSNFQGLLLTSRTKIPFSYFYGFSTVYGGVTASTSSNLPSFAIDLPDFGSTTPLGDVIPTHIDFFSTTTISKYYPDATRETFLTLGTWAIWAGLMIYLYRRVVPHHITHT